MALRREEDVRAAAALGIAPPVHLPFREAPHRGYGSAPELFSETRADDGIAADLAPADRGADRRGQAGSSSSPPRRSAAMSITSRPVQALRGLDPLLADPVVARLSLHGARGCARREPLAAPFFANFAEPAMHPRPGGAGPEARRLRGLCQPDRLPVRRRGRPRRAPRPGGGHASASAGRRRGGAADVPASMPAEPRAPKVRWPTREALAARRALIGGAHIAPIRALAATRSAAERGAPVPAPDPWMAASARGCCSSSRRPARRCCAPASSPATARTARPRTCSASSPRPGSAGPTR